MRIVISGNVEVARQTADDFEPILDPQTLKQLDGVRHDESCLDYLGDADDDNPVADMDLGGGFLEFRFVPEQHELRVVTEYDTPRPLNPTDLKRLVDFTTAQWADGIGEGFSHFDSDGNELLIDCSPFDQETEVEQL